MGGGARGIALLRFGGLSVILNCYDCAFLMAAREPV